MTQAILPAYAESPILTDNNREHPELTEGDPTSALTDSTDPPADQVAEAADTLNTAHTHKDQHSTEEAQPPTDTTVRTAYTLTHLR